MRSVSRWFQDRTPPSARRYETSKDDVAALLANFVDYVNPDGETDPWFTLDEINQQFAWDDISEEVLRTWLKELAADGHVESGLRTDGRWVWRWVS